jgi:iron(III) transport system substrate-binding protein
MKIPCALLIVGLALPGCSGDGRTTLIVYSPHGKEMLSEFEKMYEGEHPATDVQWLDMGSQDVYDRIRTERNNPQADVWWGAPWLMFMRAEDENLLEPYHPVWRDSIDQAYTSQHGCWYGTFLTPEVIMYNTRAVTATEVPRDWDDLLDARWRGKILIRYPLASGTMRIIYTALIQRAGRLSGGGPEAGFSWLSALDANTRAYTADPTQLYLRIAREEGVLTLWNLPDVVIQRDVNGYPFGYTIPKSGTPMIVDGIAIVRGTKKKREAASFYEFVTSRSALRLQAERFYRIPARWDVDRPSWLGEMTIKTMDVDWHEISENEREWMKRWDETVKGQGEQ